jgi:type I restriction enzyme S subunit
MKTLAPRLRFSEFGNDWDFKKLNSIKSKGRKVIKAGPFGSAIKKEFYVKEGYKVYGQEQVINDDAFFGDYYINKTTYNKLKSCDVKPNDILVSLVGTFGKVLLIPENAEEGVINPRLLRLSIPIELILPKFSKQYLKTYIVKKTLISWSQGGTMGVLNAEIVSKLTMPIPSLLEQQKIASFLTDVDDKITKITKKKELLERFKKGIMQKIFNQELRFKDDNGNAFPNWNVKKLGDITTINMGQSPESSTYNGNGVGYYLIQGNADISNRKTTPRNWTSNPTKLCDIGDLILTVRAPVGAIAKSNHQACIGRGVCSIRNIAISNIEFIYQFLLDYEKRWARLEQGSTFTAVSGKDIKSIEIKLPSIEEQTKIANFLSDIDLNIEAINTKIEKSKTFKKGLLQKMFV